MGGVASRQLQATSHGGSCHDPADLAEAGAANYTQWLAVVVQSEFGRELRENSDSGTDLAVTTDVRRVLTEILIRRLGNPRVGEVFPGYSDYQALGVLEGEDLPPDFSGKIFDADFESGDLSRWSLAYPNL
jgi:hypothetical protein